MDEAVYDELYAVEDSHWWFRGRRAVIRALLERARPRSGARVLDAGCGSGRNLLEFADLGQVTGVEPSPQAVAFCRSRGLTDVVEAELEQLPFDDARFDVVLAFDVLEHLDDDVAGMRELRRVTRPGGTFIATVPAYRRLWSQHDDSHHHRRRYVRRQLVANAAAAGWEPRFATYFNSILLPPIAAVRAFRGNTTEVEHSDYEMTGSFNRVLELPMRAEAAAIRRGLRFPAGVSIGMVCTANGDHTR